jgi:hypothetical protein
MAEPEPEPAAARAHLRWQVLVPAVLLVAYLCSFGFMGMALSVIYKWDYDAYLATRAVTRIVYVPHHYLAYRAEWYFRYFRFCIRLVDGPSAWTHEQYRQACAREHGWR